MRRTVLSRCALAVLLAVVGAAPLLLALSCVDERAVLLGGLLGRFDLAEAALAADRLPCCELRALLLEPRLLLGLALLLAALAFGLLVALDRGRRDPLRELAEHLRPGEHMRLVDALPVGS